MINVTDKTKDEIELISMYERIHGFVSQVKMSIGQILLVGEEIQKHKLYKDNIIGATVDQDTKIKTIISWAASINVNPDFEDKTKSKSAPTVLSKVI